VRLSDLFCGIRVCWWVRGLVDFLDPQINIVLPAQAGIQLGRIEYCGKLVPRLRGDDGEWLC
jgi:hypothetical protein